MQPIIDVNPNDLSCIYSTLIHIIKQAEQLNIDTTSVTLDQALWLKAVNIINYMKLNIVCRLGAFHLQMSFLGSLGVLMAGSGLAEVMQCCYAPNSVKHILSGKAYSRAVRAHFLVESAATIILMESLMSCGKFKEETGEINTFYNRIVSSGYNSEVDKFPDSFYVFERALVEWKTELAAKSRTAKLWINYLHYVSLLKQLIRAERTADWELHLSSISQMVNLFAATGHNNYAKCARLYVEMMRELPTKHPSVYAQLSSGRHVAHRSKRTWSGLSTDLTIEQAMMRALKGRGGITHGRGATDSVRTTWVSTVHKTAAIKTALAQFTDLEYQHDAVQHPELGKSRTARDNSDLAKVTDFLRLHNPFDVTDNRLRSVTSGIVAAESDNVTCDSSEEVGAKILKKMDGLKYKEVVLKRSEQIRTLADVTNAGTKGMKTLNIDPTLLFSRLVVIMQRSSDIKSYFEFELSALPTALFKDSYMRKPDKSQLGKEMIAGIASTSLPQSAVHVVDGGYLLHVVTWTDPSAKNVGTYGDVIQRYIAYVDNHYGPNTVIVFDGYCTGANIKDHEHQRRAKKRAPDIAMESTKRRIGNKIHSLQMKTIRQ